MSLKSLIDGSIKDDTIFNNTLTINKDVVIEGDLTVNGVISDSGVANEYLGTNNTWEGQNEFENVPSFTLAVDVNTKPTTLDYATTTLTNHDNGLPNQANDWTGNNILDELPTLQNADVLDVQLIRKTQADADFTTATEALLNENYTFTNTNTFENTVISPDPVLNAELATKQYVDNEIATLNTNGGIVQIFEYTASDTFTVAEMADVASMIICAVSAGGAGYAGGDAGTVNYGGSGQFVAFQMTSIDRDITITIDDTTTNITWDGIDRVVVPAGADNPDGVSAPNVADAPTFTSAGMDGQVVLSNCVEPIVGGPLYVPNPLVMNGYGYSGSYSVDDVELRAPGNGYVMIIAFRDEIVV